MKILVIVPYLPEDRPLLLELAADIGKSGDLVVDHVVSLYSKEDRPRKGQAIRKNEMLIEAIHMGFDYVMTMDADDRITPEYIGDMISTILTTEADVVYTDYKRTDGIDVVLRDDLPLETIRDFNMLSSFLIAKPETLLSVGGYNPTYLHEDWEMNYKLALAGYTYAVNHKGGYIYTIRDGQDSAVGNAKDKITKDILNLYVPRT